MVARTQLVVIDHNTNTIIGQATVKNGRNKGTKRYTVVFHKGRKKWVAKPVTEKKSYSFVQNLMKDVLLHRNNRSQPTSTMPTRIQNNIAPTSRPSTDAVIKAHKSRMGKNTQ